MVRGTTSHIHLTERHGRQANKQSTRHSHRLPTYFILCRFRSGEAVYLPHLQQQRLFLSELPTLESEVFGARCCEI